MCLNLGSPEAELEAGIPVYMIYSGGALRRNSYRNKRSWTGRANNLHMNVVLVEIGFVPDCPGSLGA